MAAFFGELTLSYIYDDARNSAAAYIHNCGAPDVAYDIVYDGSGVSFDSAPQRVPVSLIRLDGSVALTGHYIVDIISTHDGQYPSEHFIGSSRQIIPLSGYRDLERGDILGTASAPLLRVSLEEFVPHDAHNDVTLVVVSPMPSPAPSLATNAPPDTLDEHPSELLRRFNDAQRKSIFHLWRAAPFHIRRIDFALDAPSWDPSVIEALSTTLTDYADIPFLIHTGLR